MTWQIGDVEITQILEMEDNQFFYSFIPEAKPKKIKEIKWLYPNYADGNGNLKGVVRSFLIKSGGKNILIDTCNGNGKDRPNMPTWGNLKTDFLEKLSRVIPPEQIDFVVCTHLHFDHVGWNTKQENGKWVPTFPNAKYLFSREEYNYWIKKPEKEMIDDFNGLDDSVSPIVEAELALFVSDNFRLDKNISFIPTPGHTPHHVSVVVESQGQKAIITGDVAHHPCQIAYPEWTTGADTYPEQTIETRGKFLSEVKDKNILIIGTHFCNPTAGKIVSENNNLKFIP